VYNPHLLPGALQELFTKESGQRVYEKWLREGQRKKQKD
jgi:hypothetical protein